MGVVDCVEFCCGWFLKCLCINVWFGDGVCLLFVLCVWMGCVVYFG